MPCTHRKNWEPLVLGPALAMDRTPAPHGNNMFTRSCHYPTSVLATAFTRQRVSTGVKEEARISLAASLVKSGIAPSPRFTEAVQMSVGFHQQNPFAPRTLVHIRQLAYQGRCDGG